LRSVKQSGGQGPAAKTPLLLLRDMAILAALGVFMALLNPFGSVTGAPLPRALLYWVGLIVYGGLAAGAVFRLVRRLFPRLPDWGVVLVAPALLSLAVLPVLMLMQGVVLERPLPLAGLGIYLFYVWLVTLAVSAGFIVTFRAFRPRSVLFENGNTENKAGNGRPPGAAFMDRLSIRLRAAQLYAVESEDHYLRVHTSAGQEMILMRLADALRELGGVEGLQVHRSWWVARQGLADVARSNGKLALKLKSGAEAPVSRTYASAVKDAGWV
jgi:hypothetical protein